MNTQPDVTKFKPVAVVLAFLLGAALMLYAVLLTVTTVVANPENMRLALTQTVDAAALQTDEASLFAFADETIAYLTGKSEAWNPSISILGKTDFIPQSFCNHMTTLRGLYAGAQQFMKTLSTFAAIALIALLFLWMFMGKKPFPCVACWIGFGFVIALLVALFVWAKVDFASLWRILHEKFIPDGIFSAEETVMLLFPETLFYSYIPKLLSSLGKYGALCAVLIVLICLWSRFRQKLSTAEENAFPERTIESK